MKKMSTLFTLFILLCIFTSSSYAQVIGQIFTKEEANSRYGAVIEAVNFPTRDLEMILSIADDYVMFSIIEHKLYILDSKRNVLYPSGSTVSDEEVFSYYSKSIVEGLLNFVEKKQNVEIEKRKDVLTITHGAFTLEMQILCPPICL